ncbi:RNA polymerase sigma factor [Kaistia sp. 32K]|uniref:sigma-70 family RNA polymerase sigma factor n=1 Tax=Kaistia sp. 32K TaxID=2795690 RepID=UPI0019169D14|nr:sigma-70 family RNA polymerase sigma factor [Kaistia sp. 32K]BCP51599.1 RNA polymerase sigma factor [Kaistia sp. 32K]
MKNELVEALPMLRAFARSLSGNRDRADDLVQETVMRALANRDKFQEGTNLHAWLVTILRNQYYSEGRKRRREVEDAEGAHAARLADIGAQHGHLELDDFLRAMQLLPDEQREALVLIGASGFSYEEAAEICQVRVGTVKSRVSRARARLEEVMRGGVALPPVEMAKRSVQEIQKAMAVRGS